MNFWSTTTKIIDAIFRWNFNLLYETASQKPSTKSPYNEFMKATMESLKEKYPSKDYKQIFQEPTSF